MKKFLFNSTFIIATTTPMICFAFFCPNNLNQIDYGMTPEQVATQCGVPNSQKKLVKVLDNMPQEWTYYIPQTVALNTFEQGTGTMKTSFAFDANGQVVNITVNGIGVGASTICGQNVQLGQTRDVIQAACGKPSFINKQNAPGTSVVGQGTEQEIPVTEYVYGNTTLVFENGVLKSKR